MSELSHEVECRAYWVATLVDAYRKAPRRDDIGTGIALGLRNAARMIASGMGGSPLSTEARALFADLLDCCTVDVGVESIALVGAMSRLEDLDKEMQ